MRSVSKISETPATRAFSSRFTIVCLLLLSKSINSSNLKMDTKKMAMKVSRSGPASKLLKNSKGFSRQFKWASRATRALETFLRLSLMKSEKSLLLDRKLTLVSLTNFLSVDWLTLSRLRNNKVIPSKNRNTITI